MDDFSDDGFDDLNFAVLQELENKALQSLQSQQTYGKHEGGHGEPISVDDDVDSADEEVLRELARLPAQQTFAGRITAAAAPPPLALPAYTQRSFVDVPLPAANNGNRNASYYARPSQQHPNEATSHGGGPAKPPGSGIPIRGQANRMPAPSTNGNIGTGHTGGMINPSAVDNNAIAALQARVRMLETDLYTAQGKASIVQEKYEALQRRHEDDLMRIQKTTEDELVKQRQRAEAAIAAHKSAATELEFARQDLKEVVEKNKKGRRTDRVDTGPTTPRKNATGRSTWNVADGFDDIELLPSPSKGFNRRLKDAAGGAITPAVERTPTKGKRRRPITDSPTKPLETLAVEDEDIFSASPGMPVRDAPAALTAAATQRPEEQPLVFIQEVLGYKSDPDGPTTIELFSRYSFPSNRKQTLAFVMLQRLPGLEAKQGTRRLMLDFCQLVLDIWSQCLQEKYHAPIRPIVSLMFYIVSRDPVGLSPHIFVSVLPLSQETIYLIAAPSFNSHGSSLANHPDYTVRQLASDIDSGAIVTLIRCVAFGCLTLPQSDEQTQTQGQASQASNPGMSVSAQTWFWSNMQFEFVLLMLSSKQMPDAFLGMLALLRTSALPDSIGPITNDPAKDPGVVASVIIDRISHHIDYPPKWTVPSKYTEWDVRLAALGVLDCFAQSPFGRLSLAASAYTLPRLVGVLFPAYRELRERDLLDEPLYPPDDFYMLPEPKIRSYGIGGFDLTQTLVPHLDKASTATAATTSAMASDVSRQTTRLGAHPEASNASHDDDFIPLVLLYISSTVYLLHSIVTDPYTASVANIPAKLGEVQGGTQGFYILTMARLGFRTDPAFAVGLHDETHKLALELFKLAVDLEENQDYAHWAMESHGPVKSDERDPFANEAIGEIEDVDMTMVKMEDAVS